MTIQLIRGLSRWPDSTDTVVTIGNFDGVHRGHQAMFEATIDAARLRQVPATVISFDPLPHEYFSPDIAPQRLQGLRDRVKSIADAGIDRLLLLRFDKALADQHAADFISDVLIDRLRARHMVIGDDFRFGHKRTGTIDVLQAAAKQHGYTVQQSPTCSHEGSRISSTRVRSHLTAAQLLQASALLGRDYRISGRVIHGDKVGRQLGFPTANVALGSHRPPLRGVFAVSALHMASGERFDAVANLGERPTVGGRKLLLEVHALDHSVEWYGQHLAVDFVARIREEQRFNSLDELKVQIALDADAARELMSHR